MITELLFEPRDLWIGMFWDRRFEDGILVQHVYLGVPFFVLHFSWYLENYPGHKLPEPHRIFGIGHNKKQDSQTAAEAIAEDAAEAIAEDAPKVETEDDPCPLD
jgi:hypothetical protein